MTQVWLCKDTQERFNLKREWLVNAWRLLNVKGVDSVQPWFNTKGEAVKFAKSQNLELCGTWLGSWQLAMYTGYNNERVLSTHATYDDAYCAMHEQFSDDEIEELGVDIMKSGSTEY